MTRILLMLHIMLHQPIKTDIGLRLRGWFIRKLFTPLVEILYSRGLTTYKPMSKMTIDEMLNS